MNPSVGPCGTSSVHVDWGIALVTVTGGTVTDHCGAGTYVQVFITWNGEPSHKLGTAGPNSTASLPRNSWLADYPGGIKVTTCEHDNGWHCGTGKTL